MGMIIKGDDKISLKNSTFFAVYLFAHTWTKLWHCPVKNSSIDMWSPKHQDCDETCPYDQQDLACLKGSHCCSSTLWQPQNRTKYQVGDYAISC